MTFIWKGENNTIITSIHCVNRFVLEVMHVWDSSLDFCCIGDKNAIIMISILIGAWTNLIWRKVYCAVRVYGLYYLSKGSWSRGKCLSWIVHICYYICILVLNGKRGHQLCWIWKTELNKIMTLATNNWSITTIHGTCKN